MTRTAIGVLLVLGASIREPQSPYAGQETRSLKALSAEEIRAYEEGHGMGFAKAAELNHYPGPRHVLDLASELNLTAAQQASVATSFERMHEGAVRLGREILTLEGALDRSFRDGTIDPHALARTVADIAALQGRLRNVHLVAHLETRSVLSAEQITLYDRLRGYGDGTIPHDPARHTRPERSGSRTPQASSFDAAFELARNRHTSPTSE